MKHKVNAKLVVKNVYSGGNFENGDIVTVSQIGNEDEPDCYGAVSPHDGLVWFLYEDEVGPATNADRLRSMNDEELAVANVRRVFICNDDEGWNEYVTSDEERFEDERKAVEHELDWLRRPVEED